VLPIVIYSLFIEMCARAFGTIYCCQLEMDLYMFVLPAVFAVIPELYTLSLRVQDESPLVIENLLDYLLDSLLEGAKFERAPLRDE